MSNFNQVLDPIRTLLGLCLFVFFIADMPSSFRGKVARDVAASSQTFAVLPHDNFHEALGTRLGNSCYGRF